MTPPAEPRANVDTWALRRMNVPERLWGVTYNGLSKPLREPIRRYVANLPDFLGKGIGFWFYGPAGTGKTCGGIVILKAAWERYKVGYFTTVKDLRAALKEDSAFDSSESVMERARNADILVLDDLAVDDFKHFHFGIGDVEHLLNSRSMRGKTTILSTRVDPNTFRLEYPSILDTMRGTFHAVNCEGFDHKQEAAAKIKTMFGG